VPIALTDPVSSPGCNHTTNMESEVATVSSELSHVDPSEVPVNDLEPSTAAQPTDPDEDGDATPSTVVQTIYTDEALIVLTDPVSSPLWVYI